MFRLEDPVLGTLELSPENGVGNVVFDRSSPAARGVVTDRVNAHGSDDQTAFYGSSTVALTLSAFNPADVGGLLDQLRAFASPARRPVLYFTTADSQTERRVRLRGDQLGAPQSRPDLAAVQVQWKVPDGVVESAVESLVQVSAVAPGEPGRVYPRTYPITYPALAAGTTVANEGTEPAAPLLRLWGPCTDPDLVLVTEAGEQHFALVGVSLTAEQYAEVDVRETTALLNGRPAESLAGAVDWLNAVWWWLAPGDNSVRYEPASAGPGAHADVLWRHAWL